MVTKIVVQPISIREAFFSPYKWLVRTIEEFAMKRAANAEATNIDKMKGVAQATVSVGKPDVKPEQLLLRKSMLAPSRRSASPWGVLAPW